MKYNFKSWNYFTFLYSQIRLEDEVFRCSRVYNAEWKNEEYKKAFQDEAFDVTNKWVNMSVDAERVTNLNVEFKRLPQNHYSLISLGMSAVLFLLLQVADSYFTLSLLLLVSIISLAVLLWGLILWILGQTIVSFDVKSIINGKSYKFECRSTGNDKGLISFVQNVKNVLEY